MDSALRIPMWWAPRLLETLDPPLGPRLAHALS